MTRRLALLLFLLSLLCFAALPAVLADCPNGDAGDNVIHCTSADDPDMGIRGGDGDDSITVGENVNIQSISGNGGDDTLINNGNLKYDITGDFLTDENGDDSIVNNGNAHSIYGDTAYGSGEGGDDTIVNNGHTGSIFGDASGSNGGDDLIINNGNVGSDSYGDIVGDSGTVESGDDTIIVNGNVGGMVSGDTHNFNGDSAHSGDDLIVLQNGAAGGHDSLLLVDGDGVPNPQMLVNGPTGGHDTLVFDFTTSDEREYDNLVDQFAAAVVSTSASGSGELTFRGQTFVWVNIEELRNLIRLIIEESGGSGEVVLGGSAPTADGRLNGVADPVAIYCAADGGVTVYSINGGSGVFLLSASGEQIAAALVQGGGLVAEAGGGVLNASGDGGLVFALGGYSFPFSAAACGLAV